MRPPRKREVTSGPCSTSAIQSSLDEKRLEPTAEDRINEIEKLIINNPDPSSVRRVVKLFSETPLEQKPRFYWVILCMENRRARLLFENMLKCFNDYREFVENFVDRFPRVDIIPDVLKKLQSLPMPSDSEKYLIQLLVKRLENVRTLFVEQLPLLGLPPGIFANDPEYQKLLCELESQDSSFDGKENGVIRSKSELYCDENMPPPEPIRVSFS